MKQWRFPLLSALALMLILLVRSGFEIHDSIYTEVSGFLYNYSFSRPVLNMVLDPLVHDWGLYQCRELSYLFDWGDAKFILFCWVRGFYHQFSLCAFLFFGLTVLIQQRFLAEFYPRTGKPAAFLCSLVYSFSGAVSSLAFFRSSKHVSAFVFTSVLFLIYKVLHKKFRNTGKENLLILLLLAVGILTDRSVLFFAGAFTGMLALFCMANAFEKTPFSGCGNPSPKGLLTLLAGCFSVVVLAIACNLFLMPYLIFRVNGYYPSLLYQQMLPPAGPATLSGGLKFLLANVGKTFTGFPQGAAVSGALLLLAAGYVLYRKRNVLLFSGYVLTLCAMIVCASAMYLRHPAILWPDVIFGIYFKGFLAVLFFFFLPVLMHFPGKQRCLILLTVLVLQIVPAKFSSGQASSSVYHFDQANFQWMMKALHDPAVDIRTLPVPYRERLLTERIRFLQTGKRLPYASPGETPETDGKVF